jgi:hypothetical protein
LTDAEVAAARHEAYKIAAYAEDRENAERGNVEPPTIDDLQNLLDVVSAALGATGVGEAVAWIPDVANAGISLGRGDKVGAGTSMLAAVPVAGIIVNGTRIAKNTARGAMWTSTKAKSPAETPSGTLRIMAPTSAP